MHYTNTNEVVSSVGKNNNAIRRKDVNLYNSKDNIVLLESNKECIINGLEGFIIVEKDNSLLVCRKEDEQQIKNFVTNLISKDVKY